MSVFWGSHSISMLIIDYPEDLNPSAFACVGWYIAATAVFYAQVFCNLLYALIYCNQLLMLIHTFSTCTSNFISIFTTSTNTTKFLLSEHSSQCIQVWCDCWYCLRDGFKTCFKWVSTATCINLIIQMQPPQHDAVLKASHWMLSYWLNEANPKVFLWEVQNRTELHPRNLINVVPVTP